MEQDQKIESLHEKAASHYLKGELQAAAASWKELLSLDPEDPRALEGVRLCELLAASTDSPTPDVIDGSATPAPRAPSAAPRSGDDPESLAGLGDLFDPEPVDWQAELELPDTHAGEDGSMPRSRPASEHAGDDMLELGDLPALDFEEPERKAGQAASAPPADPGPGAAAAVQLQQRVAELIGQAAAARASGDRETALGLLSRVFILDEENEDAVVLQRQIQAELEPLAEELVPPAVAPTDAEAGLLVDRPPLAESPGDAPPDADLDDAVPEMTEDFELQAAAGSEFDEPHEPTDEPPVGPPAAARLTLVERLRDRRVQLGALLALLLLAGGWLLWGWVGGETRDPQLDQALREARAMRKQAPGGEPSAAPATDEDAAATSDESVPTAALSEDIGTLLGQARAAFETGDYAKAVLVLDQVLRLEPSHAEATSMLALAGERYREQQELDGKLASAREFFRTGDYRSGLRLLYRMPDHESSPEIVRYKAIGWYNLTLRALAAEECDQAREDFDEARQLAPDDRGLEALVPLVISCASASHTDAFRRQLLELPERSLGG